LQGVLFDVRLCSEAQSCQLEFTQKSTTAGTLSALSDTRLRLFSLVVFETCQCGNGGFALSHFAGSCVLSQRKAVVHGNSNPGTRLLIEDLQLLKEKSTLPKSFNFMIILREG